MKTLRDAADLLVGCRNRSVSSKAVVFALVGVVNAAVDYGLFLAAHVALGLSLVPANSVSWIGAVSGSYILNSSITFAAETERKLRWSSYFVFAASGIAGWLANTTTLLVAAEVLLVPVWLAKLFALIGSFFVNFSLSQLVVFRARPGLAEAPVKHRQVTQAITDCGWMNSRRFCGKFLAMRAKVD